MKVTLLLAILAISLCITSTQGWGEQGHKIVADIALSMLNSQALSNSNLYTGSKTLPDIAPLPDIYDHTSEGAWSEPCHFVNLDKDETEFNETRDCPSFCVVKSIQNYTSILSTETGSPTPCDYDKTVEPCPLEFLVHFVGDVHQPLHVSYGSDRGGNEVKVTFFGTKTDLHAVWDTGIITHWKKDWTEASAALQAMIQQEPDLVKQYESDTDPRDWANESFQYVRTVCYNFTTPSDGVPKLGEVYYDDNLPIIQQRLIAAGVRLAVVLNTVLNNNNNKKSNQIPMKIKY